MPAPPDKPWVLLREGKPPWYFPTADAARAQYDALRHNDGRQAGGACVFGPHKQAWYVNAGRYAQWQRDDERRERERLERAAQGETA